MWEHFKIDNPPEEPDDVQDGKYRDDDYDKAERESIGNNSSDEEPSEEGRLPKLDFETYADPDFDAEWNKQEEEDEISDNEFIAENQEEEPPPMFEEGTEEEPKGDTNLYKGEEWTEV